MGKLSYLCKRIKRIDINRMLQKIGEVHKRTGKNRVFIFFDMVGCGLRYQAGYMDYVLFEMYNLNRKQRKTVVTRGINNSFIKRFNDPAYTEQIGNKLLFNQNFSKFLHRDWVNLNTASEEEFISFTIKHSEFMAKPAGGSCGKGVEHIKLSEFKGENLRKQLEESGRVLLEEIVVQHKVMRELHPCSVNTCRVITITKDGVTNVAAAYLRIGNGSHVDNFNSGGMVVPIEEETGEIIYPAVDKAGAVYEVHPVTQAPIRGFKIPLWEEVLSLVKEAGKVVPQVGIVGWDVAITEGTPLLIEGNDFPGHDIYGLPPHRTEGMGVLPKFMKAMGDE